MPNPGFTFMHTMFKSSIFVQKSDLDKTTLYVSVKFNSAWFVESEMYQS